MTKIRAGLYLLAVALAAVPVSLFDGLGGQQGPDDRFWSGAGFRGAPFRDRRIGSSGDWYRGGGTPGIPGNQAQVTAFPLPRLC